MTLQNGDAVKKPATLRAFCYYQPRYPLRRSQMLCSVRHNPIPRRNMAHHNRRHSTAAERSRSFYNAALSDDGHSGDDADSAAPES